MKESFSDTKYIVTTIDDNYVQHFIVMISSLFSKNRKDSFHVYIFSNGLKEENSKMIEDFFKKNKHNFEQFKVDEDLLKDAPISDHVTLATYYRLLIPIILPNKIDKVLFLDSDIIINGNLKGFWNENIEIYSHIATENVGDNLPYIKKIEMNSSSIYFNAGIMMINLKWWRENNIYEKSIEFLKNNPHKITFWDQDVLNAILENKWLKFPLKYNAQSYLYSKSIEKKNLSNEELDAINNPLIVHFTGGGDCKPWYYTNQHPYKKAYEYHLSKSSFKNVLPIGAPILKKLSIRDKFYLFRNKKKK